MTELEKLFFWGGLFLYVLSFVLYLASLVLNLEKHVKKAYYAIIVGFVLETAAIVVRWEATNHVPTIGNYEYALAGTWLIILFTIILISWYRSMQYTALGTLACSIIMMGAGVMSNPTLRPMNVALLSYWLYVHITFAWLAYASYTVAFGIGIIYVLKDRRKTAGNEATTGFLAKLPTLDLLDDMMFRYVVFGFITDAIMIVSGALWAKDLWGSYWSWDPVETWSLVSWLIYGIIIHLRVTLGWRGKRLAWLTIFAIIGVLVTFWGVNFLVDQSMHMFNVR